MARCENCGNVVPDGELICPICGATMPNQENDRYRDAYHNNTYQNNTNSMEGEDFTYMFDPMDIAENKGMAVLSYLGLLCLIPLFVNHRSRYARFHTAQGVNLLIFSFVIGALGGVTFGLGHLFLLRTVRKLLSLAYAVLMVIGIINAVNGQAKELPVIGKIRILRLF